jgi:hypothetical protein
MPTIHFLCAGKIGMVVAKLVSTSPLIVNLFNIIPAIDELTLHFTGYNRGLKHDYPQLYEFIEEYGKKNCRVAFGPDPGNFVVFVPETGKARWKHKRIDRSRVLKSTRRVKHCSLGQNDAYVVLWADGTVTWDIEDNYPELDKILEDTSQGDVVVC